MNKPFHLMTPAERTAHRIAQNRLIADRVADTQASQSRAARSATVPKTKKPERPSPTERVHPQPPPKHSTPEFTRATPEERALLGGFIRKV